jgi:hypothetical protein
MSGIQIYQRPLILHFWVIDAWTERESGGERGRERGEARRGKDTRKLVSDSYAYDMHAYVLDI